MTPSPLASTDNYLSYPSDSEMFTIIMSKMATRDDLNTLLNTLKNDINNNNYTSRDNSPHSHPPHHEGMRDQSSLISSNHHSNNCYNNHSQNSNNNNTTSTSNNNNTASTISSPPSHPLHHQGSGGASSTYSSHSINYEKYIDDILAFSPSPILCKVTGLTIIRKLEHWLMYIKYILPVEYMPVYFASNNKAFHLAVLAWQYDNIKSQPGAALEYLVTYLNQLIPLRERRYNLDSWKAQTQQYLSDTDRMYQLAIDIDNFLGSTNCNWQYQYAVSLLWHQVWLLRHLPSPNTPLGYGSIGTSIAYWTEILTNNNISTFKLRLQHQHFNTKYAMSSPSPTPTTHKRGEELKSMSVVSASSPSAAPLALSSQNHSTQARTDSVPTQSVSIHTAKQPPKDDSPRRRENSSSSPTQSTQKEGRGNSRQD